MVRFVLKRGPFCPKTWSVLSITWAVLSLTWAVLSVVRFVHGPLSPLFEKSGFHRIPWLKYNENAVKSEAIHSFVHCNIFCSLVNTVCDSAVFRMTAHDISPNSAHDPVCE